VVRFGEVELLLQERRLLAQATQGQILSQSPTDATRFCMGVD